MTATLPHLTTIPAGTIELRDARTALSREVTLRGFEIGRTPITQAEYLAVLGATATATAEMPNSVGVPSDAPTELGTSGSGREPDAPAHGLTWFDAVRWCNAASEASGLTPAYAIDDRDVVWDVSADGFRLPTEAEWEWACRAGSTVPTYGALADVAWTAADAINGIQPVALKAANDFGVFDMLGNVWEWCWDYADTARYADYRSLRGGGWADREWSVRASVRRGSAPDAVLEDVGFRVARGAVGEPGASQAQGWSAAADSERADIRGPLPVGWTPLR